MSETGGPITREEYERLMREHEERPAVLHAALSSTIAIAKEFDQRNEASKAHLAEARAVLKLVEWLRFRPVELELAADMMFCPACRRWTKNAVEVGHAPDCRLAKVIGE